MRGGVVLFDDATVLTPAGEGRFDWDVGADWDQGRGAYGGFVAGGAARAVALSEPDPDRVLRTLSLHLGVPLPIGPATVVVKPLRVGSGVSMWSVTARDSEGGLAAHAVAVTGRARAADLDDLAAGWGTVEAPELPPWSDLEPLALPVPPAPPFTRQVEFRLAEGPPLSGQPPRSTGYVRFRDQGRWDAASLLGIADAWWVTAMTALTSLRPMPTVTFTAQLLVDPDTIPANLPLAYEAFLSGAHQGFNSETRRLWTLDGRLAVENLQTIAAVR
jgi:hypothetical protein